MSDPTAFPLTWPTGRPRKHPGRRRRGKFSKHGAPLSVAEALQRLQWELERYDARWPVISTNVELRRDGLPYSSRREPDDPGVAVYFHRDGKPYVLACDTFDRVPDNLAAVAAHIEATRAIERHGVATAEEMLRAFEALPAPDQARDWRDVLEMRDTAGITVEMVRAAHRRLAQERHPDRGGSDEMMAELNAARDRALREVSDA
ncbi:MAG: hypothetical protein ACMVO3_22515 [Thalassobaculum sp.]